MICKEFEQKCETFEREYGKNRKLVTTSEGIKRIRSALERKNEEFREQYAQQLRTTRPDYWNELAAEDEYGCKVVKITRRNLDDFLKAKEPLYARLYLSLCRILELEWKDVSEIVLNSRFIGREEELKDIHNLVSNNKKVILIWGESGIGKTRLSHQYFEENKYTNILKIDISKEVETINQVNRKVCKWIKNNFKEVPDTDINKNLEKLHQLLSKETNIGIIIDNLETTLDPNGRFLKECSSYIKLLETLSHSDIKATTIITSKELINEPLLKKIETYQVYKLKGLEPKSWYEEFNVCSKTSKEYLLKICNSFNGNAKAMLIIHSIVQHEYNNNLEQFFNSYNTNLSKSPLKDSLERLIIERFERVKKNNITAYKILCRMGCYRYQDIPRIPLRGLNCLFWEEEEQKEIISKCLDAKDYLKRSCLIEYSTKSHKYWLHPSIKRQSIRELKKSDSWEITNRKIGDFYSKEANNINNIDDALFILEACHHFIEIKDFISAAIVIIKDRNSLYENSESLGVALYRLGLFALAIEIVEKLLEEELTDYLKCRLYNIMGEFYQDNGDNIKAIEYYKKSRKSAYLNINNQHSQKLSTDPRRSFKNLYISSFYNIGLSYIALWEIDKARQEFHQIKENTFESFMPYIIGASFLGDIYCSTLLEETLNNERKKEFYELANSFPKENLIDFDNPWAFGFFGIIFGLVYIYLKEYRSAESIFNTVLERTTQIDYYQFQGDALNGLAIVHREEDEFAKAIDKHIEALIILEKVGCKVDLAEAYLQLALTYKKISRVDESEENFKLAKNIFEEIKAPRQVERIQRLESSS